MRILIHSNGPDIPTGYGNQCRNLATILKNLGHDVAVSAFHGAHYAYMTEDDIPVFPQGITGYGLDTILKHAQAFNADVIVPLMDFWKLYPIASDLLAAPFAIMPWIPVDCTPLGTPDRMTLMESGARPIGMSLFGQEQLLNAGFITYYAPHTIDTTVFHPVLAEEREQLKERVGLSGKFVLGMVAANRDAIRKAFPEQLYTFSKFHAIHPDSVLLLHSELQSANGHNLWSIVQDLDLTDCVIVSDQYSLITGRYSADAMRELYGTIDLLLNASYAEGFGLTPVEAAACGTPSIYTETSAMTQTAFGWGVGGEPWYNAVHRGWWTRPSLKQLRAKMEQAYSELTSKSAEKVRANAAAHGAAFDMESGARAWATILEDLETPK